MDDYAIWWTSSYDANAIGHDIEVQFPDIPQYIVNEFHSRLGRNGRGRLWTPNGFPVEEIAWREETLAARYADNGEGGMTGAGIVIRLEDMHHLRKLPGIITDLNMELL